MSIPDEAIESMKPFAAIRTPPKVLLNFRPTMIEPGERTRFSVETLIDLRPVQLWTPPFLSRCLVIEEIVLGWANMICCVQGIHALAFSYTKRVRPSLSMPLLRAGHSAWLLVTNTGKKRHVFGAWFECLDVSQERRP